MTDSLKRALTALALSVVALAAFVGYSATAMAHTPPVAVTKTEIVSGNWGFLD